MQQHDNDTYSTKMSSSYDRQISAQVEQYDSGDEIHDLPAIFHYWTTKHIASAALKKAGAVSPAKFFARWINEASRRTGRHNVISLGSGSAHEEIAIQRELAELGVSGIVIECQELSPKLIAEGRSAIEAAGFASSIVMKQVDLNQKPDFGSNAAVLANQSLHHMMELESIFDAVATSISGGGLFLTCDMIGRNGHKRWPETLGVIRRFWPRLPNRLKFHHQLAQYHPYFENWDCSIEGFEGVRSQDILRLMAERFLFERLFTFGGIVDAIVDRGYGPNFDVDDISDLMLIDQLQGLEEELISSGYITPTQMWSVASVDQPPMSFDPAHPRSAIRDGNARTLAVPDALIARFMPIDPVPGGLPAPLTVGDAIKAEDRRFDDLLLWGWSDAETGDTARWAVGEESAIALDLRWEQDAPLMQIDILGYVPDDRSQTVRLHIAGQSFGPFQLQAHEFTCISIDLNEISPGRHNLAIVPALYRRKDEDGGDDQRPLSFALERISLVSRDLPA